MSAPIRHIDELRSKTSKAYWTAKCWKGVLDQREFWVPRGAWRDYCSKALTGHTFQECIGELDGKPVVTGPIRSVVFCTPSFDVDGVVAIDDMDISWRQNVLQFLWNRWSGRIVAGLAWGSLQFTDPFGEAPDELVDQMIEEDLSYDAMVRDEDARRAWFESLPFVQTMRASIIYDREQSRGGPVLLGTTLDETLAEDWHELVIADGHADVLDAVIDTHLVELDRERAIGRRR